MYCREEIENIAGKRCVNIKNYALSQTLRAAPSWIKTFRFLEHYTRASTMESATAVYENH